MDSVVIASIAAIAASFIVLVGFLWYWIRKIIHHPVSHDQQQH